MVDEAQNSAPPPQTLSGGPNRIIYAEDCLNVLNDTLAIEPGSVDLIYLDPPFNSNSNYNLAFRRSDISVKPVAAFMDTWQWSEHQDTTLNEMRNKPLTKPIAKLIDVARATEGPAVKYRLDAYLINMAERLIPMKHALKPTGSLYLHCDPTASHYLKALLDLIFEGKNFRNEIIWHYRRWTAGDQHFQRMHDVIFRYTKSDNFCFNVQYEPYGDWIHSDYGHVDEETGKRWRWHTIKGKRCKVWLEDEDRGVKLNDVWMIPYLGSTSKERLGYPTQKPLKLIERIIKASTNPGDLVLDPFCGCGTTVHAAEALGRRWIGIDIARFSTGLVKNRLLSNFKETLAPHDIKTYGIPETVTQAKQLVKENPLEFEKWACGHVGAGGMFQHRMPGQGGADHGVDGVLKFWPAMRDEKPRPHMAIVQVKGGKVTADSVRALRTTVDEFDATAGVMICFNDQMKTVENNRSKETFTNVADNTFPVIQGLSVEEMLKGAAPNLPNISRLADEDVKAKIKDDSLQQWLV